jgi:hypothetical protein
VSAEADASFIQKLFLAPRAAAAACQAMRPRRRGLLKLLLDSLQFFLIDRAEDAAEISEAFRVG